MKSIVITDHCVLRYAERFLGVDFETLRAKLTEQVRAAAALGAKQVTVGDAVFSIVQDKRGATVTTVRTTAMGRFATRKPPIALGDTQQSSRDHRRRRAEVRSQ